MIRGIFLSAIVLALSQPGLAQEGREQRGLLFVQTNCASCHAVRRADASPLAAAPPLRDLHKRYPVAELAESFSEGIMTGHPTMPEFQLDGAQIGDLIAYLETLER
ncbi:MAG: cystathionine beta-lyase [Enterovirga sp.]|jgi:cytochrome c|nr:cystathionine beta-lyase [Enterovirga sp.]